MLLAWGRKNGDRRMGKGKLALTNQASSWLQGASSQQSFQ